MKNIWFSGILFIFIVLTFVNTFASNCGSQVEIGTDCNIMVQPLDSNSNRCTSNCKCNMFLYNPSYSKIIDNNKMNWITAISGFWLDTNALLNVSGEWIVDVNCYALDINRSIAGQIFVVDRDTNHLLHDINADVNLMPNKVWQNGIRTLTDYNMSTFSAFLWAYSNRSLTDYNMATLPNFIWGFSDRELTDYNQSLMFNYLEDINAAGSGSCPSVSDIWDYATRDLTDYNQSLIYTYLNDLNQTCSGGGGGLTASQVWEHSPRTLTGNTSEIQLLYSGLEQENSYRYCALDDIKCQKEQEGRNPILDQNATAYVKQESTPNLFGFELTENNLFILVALILFIYVIGFFIWRKD